MPVSLIRDPSSATDKTWPIRPISDLLTVALKVAADHGADKAALQEFNWGPIIERSAAQFRNTVPGGPVSEVSAETNTTEQKMLVRIRALEEALADAVGRLEEIAALASEGVSERIYQRAYAGHARKVLGSAVAQRRG